MLADSSGADEAGKALNIRSFSGKQLFVDDAIVAERQNVVRKLGRAVKENGGQPIRFFRTDESGRRVPLKASIYASPMYDAERGVFRMWSRVFPGLPPGTALAGSESHKHMRYGYSESRDGIEFEFVSELKGLHSSGDYNSVVTLDEHETDPAHRYKIGYDGAPSGYPNGACLAYSADGIHWTPYNDGKPVTGRAADFTNCLIWDDHASVYRLFTRTDYGDGGGLNEIRGMRMMTNPDVKANPADWKTEREWRFDREGEDERHRRQIYTMTDWLYCGVHFGLFSVYEWPNDFSEGKETDHVRRHERDVLNYYIATSRDCADWDLSWIYAGEPLVERGGDGAWDKDLILPANWIVTHRDRHWIYYGGANERHGVAEIFQPKREMGMGLATLRLDGFVALAAGDEPGTVVTHPFRFDGARLAINVDAKDGQVGVEILDEEGRPLDRFAGDDAVRVAGIDDLRWPGKWRDGADLPALRGRNVRLKFHLKNASLYAFEVAD